MANLKKVRIESDVRLNVSLKDNGVRVDWDSLQDISAALYSDDQRVMEGMCTVEADATNPENLIVRYSASSRQLLGIQRLVVRCLYDGRRKTYDVPAFVFVSRTAEQTPDLIIDDPVVDVEMEVNEVSTSLLDEAIDACIEATREALDAASLVSGGIVRYDIVQQLPDAQKAQARQNIGAVSQDYVDEGLASKQGVISDLSQIRNDAAAGASAKQAVEAMGDIVSHDASEFATAAQGAKADTALQEETEPAFNASAAKNITSSNINNWNGKLGDAPSDGKQYARKNGAWAEVEASGGTSDYEELSHLPKVNSVELKGNKSAADLGLATATQGAKADSALQEETEPAFNASAAKNITSSNINNWNGKLSDAPSDNKQYARKNGAWAEVEGGGGSAGMDLCVITLDMANVILRWPLLKDDVLAFVEAFPSLKDVMIANSADAPYYIEAQDTIDANPDVATNIISHPAIIRAIATTPAIAPIIVSNAGLDAVIADFPEVAPLIVSYPALAAQVIEYPAICPSLIAWPALAPVLVAETGYIPYLAEDSIIAHSLVDTGKRAWLVGDGVAYINTGLTQSAWPLLFSTRIKHATTGDSRYGGNYGSNNGTSFGIKSKKFYSYSKNEWQPISTAIVAEQEYAFSLKYNAATGREMTVDGSFNENTTIANVLPGATVPFGLFANKGTSPTSYHNGAMSDVQLTIGTSEYHYIPVRKNGKYGMLETSTMTFKGNAASSGRFAVELTNKSDE